MVVTEIEQRTSVLKSKLKSSKTRVQRLQNKVTTLKGFLAHLRSKKYIYDEAIFLLEKSLSEVPLTIMKRLFENASSKMATKRKPKPTTGKRNIKKKPISKPKVTRKKFDPALRSFAMTLSFYSTTAYEYVRESFNYALPALSTIRSWMTNIQCLPGYSQTAFDLLKGKVEEHKVSKKETICALILDEVAIKKQVEFRGGKSWGYVDLGTDIIDDTMECATEALVLMVVAVNGGWKVPIAYFFIESLSGMAKANIVKEALIKLHEIGITVISVTSDGLSANFTMFEKLGANVRHLSSLKPYFSHPKTDKPVFVILDACHMLKLMRNCWASLEILIDKNGSRIEYNYLKQLYEIQEELGLHFANKFLKAHIEWQRQKMKVNSAAQTISNSVADAIAFLKDKMHHPLFQNSQPTIDFLKKINNLFDLLNSRNPFGSGCNTPLKYYNEQYWRPILNDSIDYLKGLKTSTGHCLYDTRKKTPIVGFIIDVHSVLGIYDEYTKQLNVLNVRARNGWNNNPTSFQFYHTFKRLLMRLDLKFFKGNCTMQDNTHLLTVSTATTKKKTQNISLDDISIIKKYGLDVPDLEIEDHDYAIPAFPSLSLLTQNVVGYVAGFVVRMMQRRIKCHVCILSIQAVAASSANEDNALLLLELKDRGGLIRPSRDLISILMRVERYIKHMLLITDEKLPADANFYNVFCHQPAINIFSENIYFQTLNNHVFDCSLLEESHVMRLIRTAILCYTQIRLHHVAKKQTERARGEVVRKILTKLVLFSHQ